MEKWFWEWADWVWVAGAQESASSGLSCDRLRGESAHHTSHSTEKCTQVHIAHGTQQNTTQDTLVHHISHSAPKCTQLLQYKCSPHLTQKTEVQLENITVHNGKWKKDVLNHRSAEFCRACYAVCTWCTSLNMQSCAKNVQTVWSVQSFAHNMQLTENACCVRQNMQ